MLRRASYFGITFNWENSKEFAEFAESEGFKHHRVTPLHPRANGHSISVGDYVLVKRTKSNKWSKPFEPRIYVVVRVTKSIIMAGRIHDGREITRDASHFKLVNSLIQGEITRRYQKRVRIGEKIF